MIELLQAAQPTTGGSLSSLVPLLSSAGFVAAISAIIVAIVNRRKLSAEATEIITKAASGVVGRLESENTRLAAGNVQRDLRISELENQAAMLRQKVHQLEEREEEAEDERREWRQILQTHAAWDELALGAGSDARLPSPPPLFPRSKA